jgi:hypothetical protein
MELRLELLLLLQRRFSGAAGAALIEKSGDTATDAAIDAGDRCSNNNSRSVEKLLRWIIAFAKPCVWA